MTLKLVADNGEAVEERSISAELRSLSDAIYAGEYSDVERIIAILDCDSGLHRELMGDDMTGHELVGILEQVKTWAIFNGD
jgi:hypothetical protein